MMCSIHEGTPADLPRIRGVGPDCLDERDKWFITLELLKGHSPLHARCRSDKLGQLLFQPEQRLVRPARSSGSLNGSNS